MDEIEYEDNPDERRHWGEGPWFDPDRPRSWLPVAVAVLIVTGVLVALWLIANVTAGGPV